MSPYDTNLWDVEPDMLVRRSAEGFRSTLAGSPVVLRGVAFRRPTLKLMDCSGERPDVASVAVLGYN